jgi:hypothetical protein
VRRLYSTFAGGWPGTGLLLLRLVAGSALLVQASSNLAQSQSAEAMATTAVRAGSGLLLITGLWTPIAGGFIALLELWHVLAMAADPWVPLLVGAVAGALAMLGPGLWSIDARLFGWKRVDPPPLARTHHVG